MALTNKFFIFCFGMFALFADVLSEPLKHVKYQLSHGEVIHVVKASPEDYRLEIMVDQDRKRQYFSWFLNQKSGVSAAVNGGFFHGSGQPSGFFKYGQWWTYARKHRAVIGISDDGGQQELYFDRLKLVDGAVFSRFHQDPWWDQADFVLGGAPLLIYRGEVVSFEEERVSPLFAKNRYARTAFCVDSHGDMLFVLITGVGRLLHNYGLRSGIALTDFAQELKKLDCYYAVNLDGGRSSSLFVEGGFISSHWSQWFFPKRIANVLAFVKKTA
ncbi:MAG: phosphodiester glycosidase family protein [Pseudomonadota bacterium]|nr:phosphodiester glycosidase family protein [Pseudomonadota bacterium]